MKTLVLGGIALAAMVGAAAAAPITGELSLNGSDTFTADATSFTINFINPGNIGGTSGSFQTEFGAVPPQIDNAVTMISSLSNTTASGFELYSAATATVTSTLIAGAITGFTFTPPGGGGLESLAVTGTGTLTLTGFDPTPGFFDLTTQGTGGINVTFSSTQVASGVSEPGSSLGLLGLALCGFGLMWYNNRNRNRGPRYNLLLPS